jgi:hypothetical protein
MLDGGKDTAPKVHGGLLGVRSNPGACENEKDTASQY